MPVRVTLGKISLLVATFFTPVLFAGAARAGGPTESTKANLLAAMKGEAFAYLKYSLFADQARRSGHNALADAFRKAAEVERNEHFAELADLYNLVGDDVANLNDAIAGENYEATQMYPSFSRQAQVAGDKVAADRFSEIGKDEAKHRDLFKAALKEINPPRL